MKIFMLLLAIGLTTAVKLDRTYLPPPGSQYSGGQFGDLQVPLEYSNGFSTTSLPQEIISPVFSSSTPKPVSPSFETNFTTSSLAPHNLNYFTPGFRNSTTSHALTQTTTCSPIDDHNVPANAGENLVDRNSNPAQENLFEASIPQQGGTRSFSQRPVFGYQPATFNILPQAIYYKNGNVVPQTSYDHNGNIMTQIIYERNPNVIPQVAYGDNGYIVPQTVYVKNSNFVPQVTSNKYEPHILYDQNRNVLPSFIKSNENLLPKVIYDKNGNIVPHAVHDQYDNISPQLTHDSIRNDVPTVLYDNQTQTQIGMDTKGIVRSSIIEDQYRNIVPQTTYDKNGNILIPVIKYGSRTPSSHPERSQPSDRNADILNYHNVLTPEGFAHSFDASNGIHGDESGNTVDGVKVQGAYSYIGDDGKRYSVVYTADKNGFLPKGDHLPTPPPISEAILRVIEDVKRAKHAGTIQDGSYDDNKYGFKKYQGSLDHSRPSNHKNIVDLNGKPTRRPIYANDNDNEDRIDYIEEDINEGGGLLSGNIKTSRLPSKLLSNNPTFDSNDNSINKNSKDDSSLTVENKRVAPISGKPIQSNNNNENINFPNTPSYANANEAFETAGLNRSGNRRTQTDFNQYIDNNRRTLLVNRGNSNFFTVKDIQSFNVQDSLKYGKRPTSIYQGYEYLVPTITLSQGEMDKKDNINIPKDETTARTFVKQPDAIDSYIQKSRIPFWPIRTGPNRSSSEIFNDFEIQSTASPKVSNTQDYRTELQQSGLPLGTTLSSQDYFTTFRPISSSVPIFGDKKSYKSIFPSTTYGPNYNYNQSQNILAEELIQSTSGPYTYGQGTKKPTFSVTQIVSTTIDTTGRPIQSTLQPGSTVAPGQIFTSQNFDVYETPKESLVDGNSGSIITGPGHVDQVISGPDFTVNSDNQETHISSPVNHVDVYGKLINSRLRPSIGNLPETAPRRQEHHVTKEEYGRPEGFITSDFLDDSRKATKIPDRGQFSYSQAYGNQNNKGEDFHGPKQQQKYDTKTGYYY